MMMAPVTELAVLSVPQFGDNEQDTRLYDCLVGQRALWGHLGHSFLALPGTMIELRMERGPHGGATGIALRFHCLPGDAALRERVDKIIAEAVAMLPNEFDWALTPPEALGRALAHPGVESYHVARLVRRVEFVDLPAKSRSLIRAGGEDAPTGRKGAQALGWTRHLPGRTTHLREVEFRRFCLPLPGSVDRFTTRQRTLFEEFGRAGASVVSICLTSLARGDHRLFQRLALNWKRFLDPFAGELESAGFASLADLRKTYDRFALPPGYLLNAFVRVAAERRDAAIGLANVLAATLGGSKAFEVIASARPLAPDAAERQLLSDTDDVPSAWIDEDLGQARKEMQESLTRDRGIETVQEVETLDFVLHLPHIFTWDEAERLIQLPIAGEEGLPGVDSRLVAPFTVPNRSFLDVVVADKIAPPPPDRLRIGMIRPGRLAPPGEGAERFAGQAWHTIAPIDLTKHALIVGGTGSGKTMTTTFLAQEIARLGVGLMVIEPVKTEYYDLLRGKVPGLARLNLEGMRGRLPTCFLAFDPLQVPRHITVARHASYLKSCFQAAFPLNDVMALVLENGLLAYYTRPQACGFDKYDRGSPETTLRIEPDGRVFPSFETFMDFFLKPYLDEEFSIERSAAAAQQAQEWRDVFTRRFRNLADGPVGDCFRKAKEQLLEWRDRGSVATGYEMLGYWLRHNVVVELDAVPDADQKALIMALLLTYLYEHRQAQDYQRRARGQGAETRPLEHVLILEEAHRLLSNSSGASTRDAESSGESARAKAVGLFVDMLAEIRAYGQGLAIVEQIPTKIVPEAVKNTNLKIMLRLTASDDRNYLGTAMNFTEAQMRFVNGLKVERGRQINFVCFEEGVDQPILLSLPLLDEESRAARPGWLYDEFFKKEHRHVG